MNDLKYGFRQLLKNPGFTAVALLSLALGIGANTALFSVVYGVLISPYPYAKPQEIWAPGLRSASGDQKMRPYSVSAYQEMVKLPSFSDVMATSPGSALLTGEFAPENLRCVRLTASAFRFLGVRPVIGRTIQPTDIRPGGEPEPVAVLSYQLWQRLFEGSPNAIGKTLRLNDELFTIIGVMPSRFGWWTSDGVWLPLGLNSRDQQGLFPLVRLNQGVSASVAQQQWHALQLQLAQENPSAFPKDSFDSSLTNYLDITVASGEMETSLRLLFGAVAFLLLIACANVANLQLARASSRAREMAIRVSIGAGRGRLIRQLLTESVVLSLVGGALGLLFAFWITKMMVALMPSFFVPNEARIEVNNYALFFCVIVSVFTGILFGLAPAFHSSRPDLTEGLKDAAKGTGASVRGSRTRALLVVSEVALSMVLLVSAALTIRSFVALQRVDPGYHPEHVVTLGLPLPPKRYPTLEQRNRFAEDLVERVKNLPGVQAVAIGNGGMPDGGPQSTYSIPGQSDTGGRRITFNLVSADYLRVLGIPLHRGRMFSEREIHDANPLVVINEAAAQLWPTGEDPIGKLIHVDELKAQGSVLVSTNTPRDLMVVGVIANTRNDGARNEARPVALMPYTLAAPPQRTLAIRTAGDPMQLMNPLRERVREMDKEQPLSRPVTIEEIWSRETVQPRFTMALFSFFALLGLALAAAGIFSILSYLVTRRTHEFGVRIALGAQRGDLLRLVLGATARLVGVGIVLGIIGSFAASRVLRNQLDLFQVSATDPLAFVGVILLLALVSVIACYIPARRATKVDPLVALRYE